MMFYMVVWGLQMVWTLGQILYPNTGFPVTLNNNCQTYLSPGISAWVPNDTSPATLTLNISNLTVAMTIDGIIRLRVYKSPLSNNSYSYYQDYSHAVILKYPINSSISSTLFDGGYLQRFRFVSPDFAVYLRSSISQIMAHNLTSNQLNPILLFSGSILSIMCNDGKVFVWHLNLDQVGNTIEIMYLNGTAINSLGSQNFSSSYCQINQLNYGLNSRLQYDATAGMILKVCFGRLQIISESNGSILNTKNINAANTNDVPNQICDAIFCGPYLVVLTTNQVAYYRKTDWLIYSTKLFSTFSTAFQRAQSLTCLSTDGHIGFVGYSSAGSSVIFNSMYDIVPPIITPNVTTNLIPSNSSNNSNRSNSNTSNISNISNFSNISNISNTLNSSNIPNSSNTSATTQTNSTNSSNASNTNSNALNTYHSSNLTIKLPNQLNQNQGQSFIFKFNHKVISFLNHTQFTTQAGYFSTLVGISQNNFLFRQIFRSFLYFFDQFWLYRYHSLNYTKVFELFTSKIDILVLFRIKVKFLQNLEIHIQSIQISNRKYYLTSVFKNQGINQIFMLQSLKDLYTFNFMSAVIQFLLIIIFRQIFNRIKQKGKFAILVNEYLQSSSIWWNFLVSFVQTNIVVVTFYISIQLQSFYSYDSFDKTNLFLSIIVFALIFFYSYVLYHLLFRYQRISISSQVLGFTKFVKSGFWLQMILNCLRRFHVALFHGLFLNYHYPQLVSLIFLDALLIIAVIALRQQFKNKLIGILTFLYFFFFFCLDSFLFVCTQILFEDDLIFYSYDEISNFISIILVLAILIICVLQTLTNFYFSCKKIKKRYYRLDVKISLKTKLSYKNNLPLAKENLQIKSAPNKNRIHGGGFVKISKIRQMGIHINQAKTNTKICRIQNVDQIEQTKKERVKKFQIKRKRNIKLIATKQQSIIGLKVNFRNHDI